MATECQGDLQIPLAMELENCSSPIASLIQVLLPHFAYIMVLL